MQAQRSLSASLPCSGSRRTCAHASPPCVPLRCGSCSCLEHGVAARRQAGAWRAASVASDSSLATSSFGDQQQPPLGQQQWPPALLLPAHLRGGCRRAALETCVRRFYDQAWNGGELGSLDELVARSVVASDVLGLDAEGDSFGRHALRAAMLEFQAAHPLLRYQLVSRVLRRAARALLAQALRTPPSCHTAACTLTPCPRCRRAAAAAARRRT